MSLTQQKPTGVLPAQQCSSMEEVREGVDHLDRQLVKLIAERQTYMAAAARIKPAQDHVRVPWRIEDVVSKVLVEADKYGLSKRIAEPVWREMIERCIEYEHEMWVLAHPDTENKSQ